MRGFEELYNYKGIIVEYDWDEDNYLLRFNQNHFNFPGNILQKLIDNDDFGAISLFREKHYRILCEMENSEFASKIEIALLKAKAKKSYKLKRLFLDEILSNKKIENRI